MNNLEINAGTLKCVCVLGGGGGGKVGGGVGWIVIGAL